ncbi:ABC transporter substrate-binding protein [Glycomyces harbinensis]|uniref:Peptide/nickel transport system substrate-binding protein n=1 Tax=Glycomyces harbinensis TaxID=58114 RepID=A0A1G6SK07_9ACTN|nr:ABC transporter substrate-binding protein [Glycomyces harbinensis]SDD16465.1 peptide/nickel transport system substrate-binding protein [Glycomyces harbinensis]
MPQTPEFRRSAATTSFAAIAAALTLAVGACGGGEPADTTVGFEDCETDPTTCNSGPRADGGDLVWAVDGKWEAWGQADIYGSSLATSVINQPLRPSVFSFDQNGEIHYNDGIYAEAPELLAEAPLTVAYHLKEEATWGEGTPIGIDDFIWHWRATSGDEAQCAGCTPASSYGSNVASIEEAEDGAIVVTYDEGYLDAEWYAAGVITHPAHLAEARGHPDWRTDPAQMAASIADFSENPPLDYSAGPFRMVEGELGVYAKYVPNEEWTGSQQSTLDSLTLKYIESADAMATELRQGTIDGAAPSSFDPEVLDQIAGDENLKYSVAPQSGWSHIDANLNNPFLAEEPLRQALFTAIDADEVNDRAYGSAYEDIETMQNVLFRPDSEYWTDQVEDGGIGSGDLEAARGILEAAGYTWEGEQLLTPGGEAVSLRYRTGLEGNAFTPIIQDLVITYLDELGIEVEADPIPAGELNSVLEAKDWDLIQFSWIETPLFAASAADYWGEGNHTGFQDDEVDAIVDELATTLDRDRAAELNNQAAQISLDRAVQLPLAWTPALVMVNKDVVNVRDNWATTMRVFSNVGEWGFVDEGAE